MPSTHRARGVRLAGGARARRRPRRAGGHAGRGGRPGRPEDRDDPGPRLPQPVRDGARRRATRRSSSPTTCSSTSGRTSSPCPGFAESWERAADGKSWTFKIRDGHEVVRRRAGDRRGRLLLLAARPRRHRGRESIHRARLPRPGPQRRRRDEGRVPRRHDDDRLHRGRLRPDPPDLPPDPPQAHLGRRDLETIGDAKFDGRRSSAPARTRPSSGRPASSSGSCATRTTGASRALADEIVIQFFDSADTMVQALKAGEIDYARGVNADQFNALKTEPDIVTVAGTANGWTQLELQHLRHRHRQDHPGRRPVDQGPPRPGVPRRPRLRDRQAGARRPRPRRLRRRRHHARPAGPRPSGTSSRRRCGPSTSTLAKPEARRRRLRARRRAASGSTRRASRSPSGWSCPTTSTTYRQGRPVHQGLVRAARHQGRRPRSSTSGTLGRPACCRPRRRRGLHGRLRHDHLGLGRQPRSERPAPDLHAATPSAARRTASGATRATTSCTTQQTRRDDRGRAQGDPRRRCRTSSTTRRPTTSCTTTRRSTPTGPTGSRGWQQNQPANGTPLLHLRHARLHAADRRDGPPSPSPSPRRRRARRPSRRAAPAPSGGDAAPRPATSGDNTMLIVGLVAVVAVVVVGARARAAPAERRTERGGMTSDGRFGAPSDAATGGRRRPAPGLA